MSADMTHARATQPAATVYGYPATAQVFITHNLPEGSEIHDIVYAGAPGALFNNAPNNSRLWDITDQRLYVKWGTQGAIDGTWKYNAIAT